MPTCANYFRWINQSYSNCSVKVICGSSQYFINNRKKKNHNERSNKNLRPEEIQTTVNSQLPSLLNKTLGAKSLNHSSNWLLWIPSADFNVSDPNSIRSVDQYPGQDSESGSGSGRAKMTHKNWNLRNLIFSFEGFFSCKFHKFFFIKTLDPERHSPKMLDPDQMNTDPKHCRILINIT